jgi:ATP-dependent 26S proteasome regulatory subunit
MLKCSAGRMAASMYLTLPTPSMGGQRRLIWTVLSAVRMAEMINWERIVDQLSGASAAMVVKAAQDAAKAAVLGETKGVTEALLGQAVAELRQNDNSAQEQ